MAAELPKKCCCGKKYLLLYRVILQRFASTQINYLQNNFAILKINSIFVAQIKKTTQKSNTMKAYRIQSTEYEANEPSIFLLANGRFYGDLAYPLVKGRYNDVTNIEYWRTATCADDGRYFIIEDVEVSDDDIKKMEQLHGEIDNLKKQLTEYPTWDGSKEFYDKSRRIQAANSPIEHAIYELLKDVKNIIISL